MKVKVKDYIYDSVLTNGRHNTCYCHITCHIVSVNAVAVFRYIHLNVQFSEAYHPYNQELPAFLHNRPHDFLEHVCKRWTSAGDMPASNVRQMTNVDCHHQLRLRQCVPCLSQTARHHAILRVLRLVT